MSQDDRSQAAPASVAEPVSKPKKQSPQKVVDRFWEKFTTKYPGKVHNVLPANIYAKSKALHSPKGVVSGEEAVKSYDEAAAECKRAVSKIVQECRRVNHKYRDSHFDIEFDLKRGQRDCLDSFSVKDDEKSWPRSVKRVPDIFKDPRFFEDDATANDVRQGFNGDCWFLAAVAAISNKKYLIDKICVARDEKIGVYGFVFHRDGEWNHTIIDDNLYLIASDWWESSDDEKRTVEMVNREYAEDKYVALNQTGSKSLYFAQCREENETWLPLLEKAYAKAHGDYSSIDGGFTGEAIEDLTGGVTTELYSTDILDKDQFWNDEILKVNDKFMFSCATGAFDKWQGSDVASTSGARGGVVRLHAYSIMDAVEMKGKRLLKVRNPWGSDEWRGAWSDGAEEWTVEWMQALNHKFGDDGMFWISYEDLLRKYSNFERTRLFDKDWTITQQWTTVNVPWSADYNDTKFSVTLTKRSPIVIVLSQLDDRYFKGLEGQYWFQLHFRLDKDGEDDYIVRSHGNYSMRRSVSTDLELDAGTYSVLMKITAKRYEGDTPPDEVIRANCKSRQAKLISTGLAYDLAHAKGEIRETEEEKEERQRREERKQVLEKEKKRKTLREKRLQEWDLKRKELARKKRRDKRKEDSACKKAEKQKLAVGQSTDANSTQPAENGATVAAGVEAEIEKKAAVDAQNDGQGENIVAASSMPSPPGKAGEAKQDIGSNIQKENQPRAQAQSDEPTDGSEVNPKGGGENASEGISKRTEDANVDIPSGDTSAASKSQQFEAALQSIPSVTVNGAPAVASSAPAVSVAAPSTLAPGDDYQYESDASFVSSIDSELDRGEFDEIDLSTPADEAVEEDGADADDEDDAEFENNPWNAVCVIGLRVYSKDEGCCVRVVRPRHEEGDEDRQLDTDDASKGASGEKESRNVGNEASVENGVKIGVEK